MADVFEGKYGIGGVYEYMPGNWGKYLGNGLFQPTEDPDKANKIAELKKQLGDLYFRLKNGDTSVIPEIKRLSNLGVGGVFYGFADTNTGNSDEYDSLVESWGLGTPEGYKTKKQQAQEHARDAKYYAQQYMAAYNQSKITSTEALTTSMADSLAKMIAELKAESALIGGGYNFYNDESTHMVAEALANGKLTAFSYETKTTPRQEKAAATSTTAAATTFANAQTYAASNNGMTEAATAAKGTDTDAYSVVNRATTQGMVGFNQGSTYDTDNRSAVQKYSQALQGNQLGTTSSNKSKNTVANRYAVSNIFR